MNPPTVITSERSRELGLSAYPFQLTMVQAMLSTPFKKIYNSAEPGVGKTPMSLLYANSIGAQRILIITTASLRLQWARRATEWSTACPRLDSAYSVLSKKEYTKLITAQAVHPGNLPNFVVCSYNMLVSNSGLFNYLSNRQWDLIVLDEHHKASSVAAQSTQLIATLVMKAQRAIFLSGTPMRNSAADLFPALFLMARDYRQMFTDEEYELCTNFQKFVDTFVRIVNSPYGIRFTEALQPEKLRSLLVRTPPLFFRKLKSEVMPDLPPITYERFDINLQGKTSVDKDGGLQRIAEEFAKADKGAFHYNPNNPKQIPLAILRRELGEQIAACGDVYELLEDAIDQDGCVLAGAYHRNVISMFHQKFCEKGYKAVTLTGDTSPTNRQMIEDQFQAGKIDILIAQFEAAGEGWNYSRAQQVIILELDWREWVLSQFIARLHRPGQKGSVLARFICSKNPIHTMLANAVIKKQKMANFVVDGIR